MTAPITLTINVDRTEVAARGQKHNRPWVKYLVFGTRSDGSGIVNDGLPVYTFDKLSTGPVEVELAEFVKGNGAFRESWTVKTIREPKAVRPAGGDTAPARADVIDKDEVDDLRERVEALERSMARVMTKLRVEARA